jgi:hypothetical protein
MILRNVTLVAALCLLLLSAPEAGAQKATEIFIPCGKSPGLSGIHTVHGTIDNVTAQSRQLSMTDSSQTYSITVSQGAKIWLDRSKLKITNITGDFSQLKKDLLAEVKFIDNDRQKGVEWIKVQLKPESP